MSTPTAPGSTAGGANEFSGKSVEEATAEGLRRLGVRADEADVEIVSRGSRGLFGIGSEPAVVRIRVHSAPQAPVAPAPAAPANPGASPSVPPTPIAPSAPPSAPASAPLPRAVVPQPAALAPARAADTAPETGSAAGEVAMAEEVPAPPSPERDAQVVEMASEMLDTMVRLMGFTGTVSAEWRDADAITDDRHLLLSVHGQNLSALIGRRGETLENMQYLLRLMVNQKMHRWLNIIVDVEDYRAKRVEHLTHLAQRMADQVADTGRSFALEPMPPNERRIIHLALRDHPRVFTESTGDAERRKVNIFPRK